MTVYSNIDEIIAAGMKYRTIYPDPPWSYDDKLSGKVNGGAYNHYDLMDVDALKALPVAKIAAADSMLFMWCTWPKLTEGLDVIQSWGFKYVSIGFVWVKQYATGRNYLGLGRWTRGNTEFVLLGRRGHPVRKSPDVSQLVVSIPREHSRKPDEVRHRIHKLMGSESCIELFARMAVPGWDVMGNDVRLQASPLEEFQ